LEVADWSCSRNRTEVTISNDHLSDPEEIVARLSPFAVVFVMRERTPLRRFARQPVWDRTARGEAAMEDHISDGTIEQYSLDVLAESSVAAVEKHLLFCKYCRERLTWCLEFQESV